MDKIDDYRVKCARCRSTFSVKYDGRKAIVSHMQTKKHLDTLETIITQTSLESYSVLSEKKRILAAKEATWSYHTIKHNQSFRSMDCTSVLIRNLFASDFRCARTKTEAIVRNVLSPYSISQCLQELHECKFVSIYTDQSNHLDTKCFPILVRYFSKCNGISIKLIDFQSIPGETSDILRDSVLYTLKRFNLESKIVAICADNTNTNFGGAARRGVNNLYAKLKDSIHPHILGIGCSAHILNNTVQNAVDLLPIEIESIIVYTVRVEILKEFCEESEIEYRKLLGYSKTRWLTLLPAIERVIKLYPALRSYFLSLDKCPQLLYCFFSSPFSECWLVFVHNQASLFHSTVLFAENQKVIVFEVYEILADIRSKMFNRYNSEFIPIMVQSLLTKITHEEGLLSDNFRQHILKFYENVVDYLDKWIGTFETFECFRWLALRVKPEWTGVQSSLITLLQLCGDSLSINENDLFDQFNFLSRLITDNKLEEWEKQNTTSDLRCIEIFKILKDNGIGSEYLEKIVEFTMCLPGTTAPVERVFSLMNLIWTNEKSQLTIDTLKSMLLIQCNLEDSCTDFFNTISANEELLRKTSNSEKYNSS